MDLNNLDSGEAERMTENIDKWIKGEKYNKEVNKYLDKVEDVKNLLDGLLSKDEAQSEEASQKIDEFVERQAREDQMWREKSKLTAGCKTVSSRTVINNKEAEEERRMKQSEELKELGNTAFRTGKFKEAEEYYTSALMQYDQNFILFTNRAQARLRQQKYQDAVDDCKQAIKLKQDNLKTIVIITRALRGMRDYQKAMDMLEIAEKIPEVDMKIVEANRKEIVVEMKQYMMDCNKS